MAHFANIVDGIVKQVIVAEQEYADTLPGTWIQTSYNTRAGQHNNGGIPLRKNYAGVGMIYDSERDAFYAQPPYPSWILDEDTCLWNAPIPYPTDGKDYMWIEEELTWQHVSQE